MMKILVPTECDEDRAGLTKPQLRALIARLGQPGDRYIVMERQPAEPEDYIQTWHEAGESHEVEYREGSPDRHYTTELTSPDELAARTPFVAAANVVRRANRVRRTLLFVVTRTVFVRARPIQRRSRRTMFVGRTPFVPRTVFVPRTMFVRRCRSPGGVARQAAGRRLS